MISMQLSRIAPLLGGQLAGADGSFSSVSSDSRSIAAGELFVALKGPNFDGHDYLEAARARGAVAALVDHSPAAELSALIVKDTRAGLGDLARIWRQRSQAPLIALTGSNGKTTVKEMIAAILSRRGEVLATRGNLNNDVGLPLTLLRLQEQDFVVLEMGANHAGEIAYLSKIALPDIALITNAGRAHLQGFGSLEGVAKAKSEILQGLKADGCFVLNEDDAWADLWRKRAGNYQVITFGVKHPADVSSPPDAMTLHWSEFGFTSRFPVSTPAGGGEIELKLAGNHNRLNALAAIATAQQAGASWSDIEAGLASLQPVSGRLQPLAGRHGVGLINDAYNANPDSVKAAIDLLASAPGQRYLVLGELAEMGQGASGMYREIGQYAKQAGIERLYTLIAAAEAVSEFGPHGASFTSLEQLIERLDRELQAGDRVLVKGSRVAAMERVVKALSPEAGG